MVRSFSSDLLEQKQELCCITSSNMRHLVTLRNRCYAVLHHQTRETFGEGVMLCYIIKHETHLVRVCKKQAD